VAKILEGTIMKRTTKALKNPFVKEALSCCVQDAILELLQGDKELASLEIALAIDKMMEDMTVRLLGGGSIAIIEVKHPKGYEYPPIEITVKKIVDQFIKDELSGSPWEDFMPESTKEIVDSFYNQAVRLKKAFNKYASQKYIPKK
jgi:tRNA U54 and U55 pseudouridine synthase Pus10